MSKKKHIEILERLLEDRGFFEDVYEFRSKHSIPEAGLDGIKEYLNWHDQEKNRKLLYQFINYSVQKYGVEAYAPMLEGVLQMIILSNQLFEQSLETIPYAGEVYDGKKMNLKKMPDFHKRVDNSVAIIIDPHATHADIKEFINDKKTYEIIKNIREKKGQDPDPKRLRIRTKRNDHAEIYKLYEQGYFHASDGTRKRELPEGYDWLKNYDADNIKKIINDQKLLKK